MKTLSCQLEIHLSLARGSLTEAEKTEGGLFLAPERVSSADSRLARKQRVKEIRPNPAGTVPQIELRNIQL